MSLQGKLSMVAWMSIVAFFSGVCWATPMINQKVVENELVLEDYSGDIYSVRLDCRRSMCLLHLRNGDGELLHTTELSMPGERFDPQYLKVFSEVDGFVPDYYYVEVGLEECPGLDGCAAGFLIEKGKQVAAENNATYVRISRKNCRKPNQKC